eukprot:symbB.v1.2.026950.t2/scaffold2734.1/size73225/4
MAKWTGLEEEPIFCPAVGDFKQGMVVSVPLRFSQLRPGTSAANVHEALQAHYKDRQFVSVKPLNDTEGQASKLCNLKRCLFEVLRSISLARCKRSGAAWSLLGSGSVSLMETKAAISTEKSVGQELSKEGVWRKTTLRLRGYMYL